MKPDLFARSETRDPDAELRRRIADLRRRIAELEAENARLVERCDARSRLLAERGFALRAIEAAATPIAAYAEACDRMAMPDDLAVLYPFDRTSVTAGDFRALRAALRGSAGATTGNPS